MANPVIPHGLDSWAYKWSPGEKFSYDTFLSPLLFFSFRDQTTFDFIPSTSWQTSQQASKHVVWRSFMLAERCVRARRSQLLQSLPTYHELFKEWLGGIALSCDTLLLLQTYQTSQLAIYVTLRRKNECIGPKLEMPSHIWLDVISLTTRSKPAGNKL